MQWISVKDRLPSEDEEVGYTFDGEDVRDDIVWNSRKKTWNRYIQCVCNSWEVDYVTHWMPWPEPPEE